MFAVSPVNLTLLIPYKFVCGIHIILPLISSPFPAAVVRVLIFCQLNGIYRVKGPLNKKPSGFLWQSLTRSLEPMHKLN